MVCMNCGHPAHQHMAQQGGGVMCTCGCTNYVPDTTKQPPKKETGHVLG